MTATVATRLSRRLLLQFKCLPKLTQAQLLREQHDAHYQPTYRPCLPRTTKS